MTDPQPIDGRTRKSQQTRATLLEGARRIAQRDGLSAVTLERVATEAKVSKGGLLYHFESKRALLRALLSESLATTDKQLTALTTGDEPGAFARAYLEFVRTGAHGAEGVATGIFASAALDDGELTPAQDQFSAWQDRLVSGDGIDPTLALLARVVGDGLWLIDLFGLAPPEPSQRNDLIDLTLGLIDG